MHKPIISNPHTNPDTNVHNQAQTEKPSRKLSRKERKRLGYAQTNLKQKNKKLERLNKEKTDLKETFNRGYWIIKSEKEGENESSKKTQVTLTSMDRLKIRDSIIDIDIELFELEKRRKTLSTKIVAKREQSIRAKQSILSRKKMAQKQKRNATSPGEEDSAPVYLYQPETELEDTQSSDGEFDFMDKREPVAVPLQKKETKVSVNTDAEVIQE